MSGPLAFGTGDIWYAYTVFYTYGGQELTCLVLGFMVAHKTARSVFNWLIAGLLCGLIPGMGIPLMLLALVTYPPAPPSYASRSAAAQRANAEHQRAPAARKRPRRRP